MSSRRFSRVCEICSRVYSIESSKTAHCHHCEENLKIQANSKHNMTCSKCDRTYYSPNHFHTCPFCQVKGYDNLNKEVKVYDNKKVKKKRRGSVSIQELIRRSEYKRVMDDSGWEHYCKGRKWDKI